MDAPKVANTETFYRDAANVESKASEGYSPYAAHEKIYPREVTGRFQQLRRVTVWLLLGAFYLGPWLVWDGRQAILFDLPARKFYVFWMVFWPQDFYYLTWLLVLAALSLFLVTALAGRVWCGYACPQTVWTELFIWLERFVEGSRSQQLKLANGPWNRNKIFRKTSKHFLWLSLSLFTGFTFVGYFTPMSALGQGLVQLNLGPWQWFWVIFYSFATYGNAGFMREQVCKYMCPYARFQGAMFDPDSLIVSYDKERGEPRGSRKRGTQPEQLGSCIDCQLCVQVCPTGIDIRQGLQYECIACAACIDVCDSVMEQMDYPKGLIRYTTENALAHKKSRVIRPRTIIYSAVWVLLSLGFLLALLFRTPLDVNVLPDRNQLYREIDGDRIENSFQIKILNKDEQEHQYQLSVQGLPSLTIISQQQRITVPAGQIFQLPLRIQANKKHLSAVTTPIEVVVTAIGKQQLQEITKTRFYYPTVAR